MIKQQKNHIFRAAFSAVAICALSLPAYAETRQEVLFNQSDWTGSSAGAPAPTSPGDLWDSMGQSSFKGTVNKLEGMGSIELSRDIKRAGDASVRFQTGLTSPGGLSLCPNNRHRAEVVVRPGQGKDNKYVWDDGLSHWVGVSIYPRKFDNPAYTLFQFHSPNEGQGNPCEWEGNAITIKPDKIDGVMHYALYIIVNGGQALSKGGANGSSTRVWSEPMNQKGFTDFIINFTLSTKKQGYVTLWRNGERVYQGTGLTNVNYIDSCGAPIPDKAHNGPHMGIYGPPCRGTPAETKIYGEDKYREAFFDELRTATGPNGYAEVDPARNDPKPPVDPKPPIGEGSWVKAADEWGNFVLRAPRSVRYGTDGKWETRARMVGPVACNNNTFGDPAPGVAKRCEVFTPPSTPVNYIWTKVADEWGSFTLTTTKNVRYGLDGIWFEKLLPAGAVQCNNTTFGDPVPGKKKICQVRDLVRDNGPLPSE